MKSQETLPIDPSAPLGVAIHAVVGRRVAVTDRIVKKIIARAEASQLGLSPAETSLEIGQYAQHNLETLALLLVAGWHGKYDLVSVFAAAMQVIEEESSNAEVSHHAGNGHE